ncbi:hypothetical protein ACJJTC_000183, partial [Scirpophaga incertulas]
MPRVKIDFIVSFSSEDPENPANNLLNWEVSKKRWLCTKGEPSCSVVLQLTKAVLISAVHIGSHHSALVEVLVGRSEKPNDPFEVLVPSSIFLTPSSSRSSEAVERVRSFSSEQLGPAQTHRWDRVRVVCSQPYNKHCKYGLSFIHIYEPEGQHVAVPAPQPALRPSLAGQGRDQSQGHGQSQGQGLTQKLTLALDSASSDSDDFRPGELFAKHRATADTGAQIRQATSHALKNIDDSSTKLVKTAIAKHSKRGTDEIDTASGSRQRDELLYTDEDRPHGKIDRIIKLNKEQKARDTADKVNSTKDKNLNIKEDSRKADRTKDESAKVDLVAKDNKNQNDLNRSKIKHFKESKKESPHSKDKEMKAREKNKEIPSNSKHDGDEERRGDKKKRSSDDEEPKVPLESVLSGVVFVLSGYQNSERAALRQLAADMGARYLRDWAPCCNLLVCAFPNTPKLRQARAAPGGRHVPVVSAHWIRGCYSARRRLPLPGASPTPHKHNATRHRSDDDDTDDEIERVLKKKKRRLDSSDGAADDQNTVNCDRTTTKTGGDDTNMCDDSSKPSDDVDMTVWNDASKANDVVDDASMGYDEDVAETTGNGSHHDSDDATDTEEQPRRERIDPSKSLPLFFEGHSFLVRGAQKELLRRYITAYGGLVLQ